MTGGLNDYYYGDGPKAHPLNRSEEKMRTTLLVVSVILLGVVCIVGLLVLANIQDAEEDKAMKTMTHAEMCEYIGGTYLEATPTQREECWKHTRRRFPWSRVE